MPQCKLGRSDAQHARYHVQICSDFWKCIACCKHTWVVELKHAHNAAIYIQLKQGCKALIKKLLLAGGSKTPEPDPSTLHHTGPVALDHKTMPYAVWSYQCCRHSCSETAFVSCLKSALSCAGTRTAMRQRLTPDICNNW